MKKILILDDEPDIVDVISIVLSEAGYHTLGIGSGAQLFNTIESFKPDLIILDIMLGSYDGRILCSEIKSQAHIRHIPIIMVSASHDIFNVDQGHHQPNDFLPKPFDIDVLVQKVKEQLEA